MSRRCGCRWYSTDYGPLSCELPRDHEGLHANEFRRKGIKTTAYYSGDDQPNLGWVPASRFGRYVKGLLISIDQFGNALWGGDPDETISSRIGRLWARGQRRPFPGVIRRVLERLDPGHCDRAIEHDEGANAVYDRHDDAPPPPRDVAHEGPGAGGNAHDRRIARRRAERGEG